MKPKTKRILSGGLAFSEQKDMEKLSEYSKKGWHLKEIKYCFYILEEGEPADYIYAVDYQTLNKEELNEYKAIAKDGGWDVLQYYEYFVLLRAMKNTKPIYSDQSSYIEREKYFSKQLGKSLLSFLFIILVLIVYRNFMLSLVDSPLTAFFIELAIYSFSGATVILFISYVLKKLKLRKLLN